MRDYRRQEPGFSLCGLNCRLCPMHLGGYCPGCGGGEGHQPCTFIRCSRETGGMEYCFQCPRFPCERYERVMEYDSFLPHGHMVRDQEMARDMGLEDYLSRLEERRAILDRLLAGWNDGRTKSFYCLAVYLLEAEDLHRILEELERNVSPNASCKERAAMARHAFQDAAAARGIGLRLNKRPKEMKQE